MEINSRILQKAGIGVETAQRFAAVLPAVLGRFNIDTPRRAGTFLAQCAVESGNFTRLSENLVYSTPERLMRVWPRRFRDRASALPYVRRPERLANAVYARRLGNGPEESGDGWAYRGRGLIQLTGRVNYRQAADALARPYVEEPELVAGACDAALTAAWFWYMNGCNALADKGDVDGTTRKINGPAMLGAAVRRQRAAELLRLLETS